MTKLWKNLLKNKIVQDSHVQFVFLLAHIQRIFTFSIFEPFRVRVWLKNLQKVLIWPEKYFFPNNFDMGIKKIEFHDELKSIESNLKDYQRKLLGWDLLYTILTRWKSSWFLHFHFLRRNFLQFFKLIRSQHKILSFFIFLTSISKLFVKISEGHVSTNFEAEQGHNGSKKQKLNFQRGSE